MEVSVIIATFNRPADLAACLASVASQTNPPEEIIVVDDSTTPESERVVGDWRGRMDEAKISLRYHRNPVRRGLTTARNAGAALARGEILLFVDDDVVLDKNYVCEILRVFEERPQALGVQGYIPPHVSPMRDLAYKVFRLYHHETGRARALPSISATYPRSLDDVASCEWLSGANHAYRRQVLSEFQYDERLMKYSEGEDLEMSYRVYQRYPGSLFITPRARLVHNTSSEARLPSRELVEMREVYGLYLFHKLYPPTISQRATYAWSRIGRLLFTLARAMTRPRSGAWREVLLLWGAFALCIRERKRIRQGDLEFFNDKLRT